MLGIFYHSRVIIDPVFYTFKPLFEKVFILYNFMTILLLFTVRIQNIFEIKL